ncbi:MAG TPA: ATP-binding protein [Flavitalea sp.]|nr:ATP-binding protein [Flavitalea sp.]
MDGTKKLNEEIKDLQQQLSKAREPFGTFTTDHIDALVVAQDKILKVYTENAADKIYRILIENMNEGAVTLSEVGAILYCNSYFASLVKIPLQKVIGTKFEKFAHESEKQHFESLIKQGREKPTKEEISIYASDGKAIPVLMSLNTVKLDSYSFLSIIVTDLTIQNRNREELKEKSRQLELKNIELGNVNKDLTSFTYVSSHDLQEPLRKIQNFVTLILDEEKNLSESGKGFFQRIVKAVKRMQALIEDLLIYSRTMDRDRKFEKTDLSILLNEVKKDYEAEILEKKAIIESDNLCEVSIIKFQFRQLLNNLISNSFKFSKAKLAPHIVFTCEIISGHELKNETLPSDIEYYHLTYIDNGIGFDPQYNDRIFEVFQRLHSNEAYTGTGMGLAICKRIVENHNGIIKATGTLDGGARFDIYIPFNG